MAVLSVELSFPAAPITSLLKRITKGIEHLYYVKLFLTNPAYRGPQIWRAWLDLGFHLATYSPPPGTARADRVRVRTRAPSRVPIVSLQNSNTDALKGLGSVLCSIDQIRSEFAGKIGCEDAGMWSDSNFGRQTLIPLLEILHEYAFEPSAVEEYETMVHRAVEALTNKEILTVELTQS
jgi:hypothetical protein